MDVLISPSKQALIVNPESPHIAMSIAKGIPKKSLSTPPYFS